MLTRVAIVLTTAALLVIASPVADARDTRHKFAIATAMGIAEASGKLPQGIKFYFGDQKHPKPKQVLGVANTNKKTNFFNKSDQEGCEWTFLSAMVALGEYAQRRGGNAVVNIKSNYRNVVFSSATEYECGAGAFTGGVAFTGDVVKLP
jgi:hypothetical protein